MTTHQHQGATDVSPSPPSWPSAGPPTPAAAAAGTATPAGGTITLAGAVVIFVAISIGLLSLQHCIDAWDRETHGLRSRRRRRRGDGTVGSDGGVRTRGVDPELLRALPVTVYRAGAAPGSKEEDAVECAVCLAELQDGEVSRFLPRCGHGFHAECVDMWLASHTTCPLCRLTLTVVSKPDPESSQTPTPALALRPLPPEPAANLPRRSVLVVVSDHQGVVTAANMSTDDGDDTAASASTAAGAAAALVIEIPELAPVPTPTPRDAAKSPVSARPRSFRRLWSFGRQGPPSSSSSCACSGAGEVADVEQGSNVTIGVAVVVAEAQVPSEATAGVAQGSYRVATDSDVRQAD